MRKLDPQEAAIYLMVMVSASDRDMVDPELSRIGAIVRAKPTFGGFAHARILQVARDCQQWLQDENGMEEILDTVAAALTPNQRETAYAFCVDIAVSDLNVDPAEYRLLQILRDRLDLTRSVVSAIEQAAKIRHRAI